MSHAMLYTFRPYDDEIVEIVCLGGSVSSETGELREVVLKGGESFLISNAFIFPTRTKAEEYLQLAGLAR
ncbi:hypothetical protein [Rhodobacter sp. NSM]|uniref:hypothetical protein n=1 Tax=Rhodobacter sp. NSM TaxID=3457501 RepID=UPI003FD1883A